MRNAKCQNVGIDEPTGQSGYTFTPAPRITAPLGIVH
jgi:hypothetical protein